MAGICEGRVVIVTGAGRGIGREHALAFAREGAKVVVNDIGLSREGSSTEESPGEQVVREIEEMGGEAVANRDDVADWAGAERLVRQAVDHFGRLDTLVCNAGFLRDRMFVNMSEEEWDAVIRVHLKGHFAPMRHAAAYWRDRAKAGETNNARVILTSSGAGLYGAVGQGNYGVAKAGIATMARIAGAEFKRYGITVNAIAPAARTRMTEGMGFDHIEKPPAGQFDAGHPANISPLVVWLGSEESGDVTGQVFDITGGLVIVAENWRTGPERDKGDRWEPSELGPVVRELLEKSHQVPVLGVQ